LITHSGIFPKIVNGLLVKSKPTTEDSAIIYLASPYSHEFKHERELRFRAVRICALKLMMKGLDVFSPIAYGHQFSLTFDLPYDAKTWARLNTRFLVASSALYILDVPGWVSSLGVTEETRLARQLFLPVKLVSPEGEVLDEKI